MSLGNDTQRSFDEAPAIYFDALTQAGIPEERTRQIAQTYAAYLDVLQEPWTSPELQDRARGAFERYAVAVAETWSPAELSDRAATAYRNYVRTLREAWADIDEDAMDPATLAAIAQGMQNVAWSAGLSSAAAGPTESVEGEQS